MIRVRVIGDSLIEVDCERVTPSRSVLFAVLLYLCLQRGKRVPRGLLLQLLWPQEDTKLAQHCLRQSLYKLKQLGAEFVTDDGIVMLPQSAVSVDYESLRNGVAAVELPGSIEVMPGYAPNLSEAFSEWLEQERTRITSHVCRHLVRGLVESRSRGRWEDVERISRQCLLLDPFNEEATLALAESAALTGRKADALAILANYQAQVLPYDPAISLSAKLLANRISQLTLNRSGVPEAALVGREIELSSLFQAAREARNGSGSAHLISGAPGIGKTRLLAELRDACALEGFVSAAANCRRLDQRRPLSVFSDLVPNLLRLPGSLGCSPHNLEYLRRVTQVINGDSGFSAAAFEGDSLRSSIRCAFFDLLNAITDESPLLLALEDVQWMDSDSWNVISELTDQAQTNSLLLIMTSREAWPVGLDSTAIRLCRLNPLDDSAAQTLARHLLPSTSSESNDALVSWCARVTEGNPLHIIELVRHWNESGIGFSVPPSIKGLIRHRIEQLPTNSRRILQVCVLLGRSATLDRLRAVMELASSQLLDALEQLETAGLVHVVEQALLVKHELIAEAALAVTPSTIRLCVHDRIASLLEDESKSSSDVNLRWDCAQHWLAAGQRSKATQFLRSCAKQLVEMGMPDHAATLLKRSLEGCPPPEDALALSADLIDTLRLAFRFDEVAPWLSRRCRWRAELGQHCTEHSDDELIALQILHDGNETTQEIISRAVSCAGSLDASPLHRLTAIAVGMMCTDRFFDKQAAEVLFTILRQLTPITRAERFQQLRATYVYHTCYGDLELAVAAARSLMDLVRDEENIRAVLQAQRNCALVFRRCGLFSDAKQLLSESLAMAERLRLSSQAIAAIGALVDTCAENGEMDEAAAWLDRGREWSNGNVLPQKLHDYRIGGALLKLHNGDTAGARELMDLDETQVLRVIEPRMRAEQVAYVARMQMLEREDPLSDQLMVELEKMYVLGRRGSCNDLVSQTYVLALHARGRYRDSAATWDEYTREHRRDRHAISRAWQGAASTLRRPTTKEEFRELAQQIF